MSQKVSAAYAAFWRKWWRIAMENSLLLAKGSPVKVKCASGDVRSNVVWEDHGSVVLVCSSDQFKRLAEGYDAPMPIGFRRADVFPTD